jgi:phosphate uptake regulator
MIRKVIRQGHNTLTITLPSEWARRFNLDAGNEVSLTEKENGLFVSTEKNWQQKKVQIDIAGLDLPTIWKYFMAVYREGYDEVKVIFDPNKPLPNPYRFFTHHLVDSRYKGGETNTPVVEVLQGFVSRFIGFEIIEHGSDYILVKEMGSPTSKEFENSLRRIFLILQQMLDEVVGALENNNPKILQHMHDVDINLDKFHDYCVRILNRTENKESNKRELLVSVLFYLELIGDECKNIAHHFIYDSHRKERCKTVRDIAETIREQFNLFYEVFYKFDKEKIVAMSEIDKKRYFTVDETQRKIKQEWAKEIFHHLRIITRYLNVLSELRIEMEF